MADLDSNYIEGLSDYRWKEAEIQIYVDRDIDVKVS